MLIYALQTALSLAVIFWLVSLPLRSRAGFWMLGLAAVLLTLLEALQGVRGFLPWWVPYLMAMMLVGAVAFRLIRAPARAGLPFGPFGWLSLAILVGIAGLSGAQSSESLRARQMPSGPFIELAWPLGPGIFLVADGVAASINAHSAVLDSVQPLDAGFGGSGYGLDLIAENRWGIRAPTVMPAEPARHAIFGTPVLATSAGQVLLAVDGRPDLPVSEKDEGHPAAGNHVLLRCGGFDIRLGHFRQGSLRVAVGDRLIVRQQIGDTGNPSESAEPHPHIHARTPGTPENPFSGTPVPIRLEGRFLARNDLVETGALPGPTNP